MREKGVSLIESLMVVVIISTIVLLMANLPNAMGLIQKSRNLSLAREIAAKAVEDKRSTSYANLVSDPLPQPLADSRITLLPNGSGEVLIEDCDLTICTSGEPVKQVTVTLNWKDHNKEQKLSLKTFIGEGGLNQ